jgi:glycosyltransferase involved in cell wall biosynthesis
MHIGIDAHQVGTQLGGNASYISGLITALGSVDTKNQYTLYTTQAEAVRNLVSGFENFNVRLAQPKNPLIRIPLSMNLVLRKEPVDVLLVQYTAPPFAPCKVVSVIHDISYEHIPETFRVTERIRMKLSISQTARSADRVVVPSEYTRQDIIATYKVRSEKVHTVPLAADETFMPITDRAELDRVALKYGLEPGFILGLGSIQPRKNLVRLIEAYSQLSERCSDIPSLVLVGKKAWLFDESIKAARTLGTDGKVRFTGFAPQEDLPALYTLASCFVYPSYFEGFGIPPLEAMQCGTPVMAGDRTSIPEVVGDAGILVDPFDVSSISNGIERLLFDDQARNEFREKGFQRAATFSWKRTARETLNILEKTVND